MTRDVSLSLFAGGSSLAVARISSRRDGGGRAPRLFPRHCEGGAQVGRADMQARAVDQRWNAAPQPASAEVPHGSGVQTGEE